MRLTLIRHGQSQLGDYRVVGGHRGCMGLTPKGVVQARDVGEKLLRLALVPDFILCSVMRRSRQSALILGGVLGAPIGFPTCLLCEVHPGVTDSLSFDDLGGYGAYLHDDHPIASGGESIKDLNLRTRYLVELLEKDYSANYVALVTHFGVVESFTRLFLEGQVSKDMGVWFGEGRALVVEGSPLKGFALARLI